MCGFRNFIVGCFLIKLFFIVVSKNECEISFLYKVAIICLLVIQIDYINEET